ncbi:ATP-binding protein [Microbacterium elymi]|uniref:NB-ARC domain-containing protein n=1 Tax=Microbacterium elymi TaxID=2909587 RepID=A0ABY5NGP3_9MICO|nr:hypothetical protein [Microbacterium elymi]UUT34299.1 hypothetical protein L2X98_26910 [Microbacterium elymi]
MTRADGGNAPVPATSLVGRRAARTAVRRALEQTSFVTLTGPGGIGKSRLAIAVAEDVLPKYPDGVWFIDLSELPVDVKIEDYVLDAIAGPDHSQRRSEGRLISYLRSLRALLIFDNCESQLGPAIKLITRILSSGRDIHVLATSREAFDSVRERVIPVQPLGVPDADAMVDPYHVAQFDSVKPCWIVLRRFAPAFASTRTTGAWWPPYALDWRAIRSPSSSLRRGFVHSRSERSRRALPTGSRSRPKTSPCPFGTSLSGP